ncbi:hypothetical protein [Marinibacterium profundimaris]|uniref:Uncharacterized protein n=1 Tax=Marinibacterium profundimaris TaxID=1679460 RepID=A0A225NL68_9RHOB|nr:hypothetical protein [Marinibacterium profundimaris]OWU74806.1 hypothetical protein ATO3_09415 [Marinibacterium profundimaris]
MTETMTIEAILSITMAGLSACVIAGSLRALIATRQKVSSLDTSASVRSAPFHRLHNVVSPKAHG